LLIASPQPGLCELVDVMQGQQLLTMIPGGGAYYFPTTAGQPVPFTATVGAARMWNNSTSRATMTVLALLA
jgi:hypothetical protein